MKKLLFVSVLVVLVIGLVLVGCQQTASTTTKTSAITSSPAASSPAGNAPTEIVIAAPASMTGTYSNLGLGGIFAAKRAVADINAQGGIFLSKYNTKVPIKIIVVDDQSDENKSATLAEDIILHNKAQFILGPSGFPQFMGARALVAEKYNIVQLCPTMPMEPALAMRDASGTGWKNTWFESFAIGTPIDDPTDFRYGKAGYTIIDIYSDLVNKFGSQTNMVFGVFASDDPDGVGWYASFPGAIAGAFPNAKIIGVDKKLGLYPTGTTDFSATIKAWKDADVQILWGNSDCPDFAVMYRQAKSMGFEPKMVGAARACLTYADVSSWGGDLPNGVGTELWGYIHMKDAVGIGGTTPESLAADWEKDSGQPFNMLVPHSYAIVQELAKAIEMAGTTDTTAVNAAFANLDMQTIAGRVKFNKNHVTLIPLTYAQWFPSTGEFPWEMKVVTSAHDFVPVDSPPIFPIP